MCQAAIGNNLPDFLKSATAGVTPGDAPVEDGRPKPIRRATEVPLGDGLADAAKTSILSRRDRIRQAVEEAGG